MLTETWTRDGIDPTVGQFLHTLSGFNILHQPRKFRRGGGVGLLVRTNLSAKKRCMNFKSFQYLEVAIRARSQLFNVFVIYRPPYSSKNQWTVDTFLSEFRSLLEVSISRPGFLLIGGDFNFHCESSSPDVLKLMDLIASFDLCQHVKESTHDKGHMLDLILTRASDDIIRTINISSGLPSDHSEIIVNLSVTRPPVTKKTIKRRNLVNLDTESFRTVL